MANNKNEQEEEVTLSPGTIALAKVAVGLGVAGLLLAMSPWSLELLFKAFVLPLAFLAAVGVSLGIGGQGILDFYNSQAQRNIGLELKKAVLDIGNQAPA